MYTTDFEYAGEKLSDYGMMICKFDNAGGIEAVSSGSDITFHQIPLNKGSRYYIASSTYESAMTTTIQICKNPDLTNTPDNLTISIAELSALQRWLCRKNQYHKFKIDQEGFEQIYWNATFSAKQIMLKGEIIGLELTLYTDAPYAYADEIFIHLYCSDGFDIYNTSDEEGAIYPDIEITLLGDMVIDGYLNTAYRGGKFFEDPSFTIEIEADLKLNALYLDIPTNEAYYWNGEMFLPLSQMEEMSDAQKFTFTLKNQLDDYGYLSIKNCSRGEVITIQGKSHIISSSNPQHSLSEDFNYYYPRILNSYTENKNTFTSNTKCTIKLSYSPIRKVGI